MKNKVSKESGSSKKQRTGVEVEDNVQYGMCRHDQLDNLGTSDILAGKVEYANNTRKSNIIIFAGWK